MENKKGAFGRIQSLSLREECAYVKKAREHQRPQLLGGF